MSLARIICRVLGHRWGRWRPDLGVPSHFLTRRCTRCQDGVESVPLMHAWLEYAAQPRPPAHAPAPGEKTPC